MPGIGQPFRYFNLSIRYCVRSPESGVFACEKYVYLAYDYAFHCPEARYFKVPSLQKSYIKQHYDIICAAVITYCYLH